jgi:hypothetical protein
VRGKYHKPFGHVNNISPSHMLHAHRLETSGPATADDLVVSPRSDSNPVRAKLTHRKSTHCPAARNVNAPVSRFTSRSRPLLRRLGNKENHDPCVDLISHLAEGRVAHSLRPLHRSRIFERPVQLNHTGRKDRARFLGVIAHRDHDIQVPAGELIDGLRSIAGDVDADSPITAIASSRTKPGLVPAEYTSDRSSPS